MVKVLKNSSIKNSTTIKILILIAIAVIAVVVLEATNTTHIFHKAKTVITIHSTHSSSTTAPSALEQQPQSSAISSPANNQVDKTTAPVPAPSSSSSAPVRPTGTFISDHRPNLSGQPNPSQENSVCVTTPGATCYIEFTQGNVVKKLDTQGTDSNGAAYWTWDVKEDGFSTGSWQVAVVATLNGRTATSTDVLEVQP